MVIYQLVVKKVVAVLLVLLFMNSIFIILDPEVYTSLETFLPISLLTCIVCFDVAIRSISPKEDQYDRVLVSLAFLLFPFMVALPHFEWKYLTFIYLSGIMILMRAFGMIVLLGGSVCLLASRIQIGRYGGAKIAIEDDHRLVTSGMYKYIRNPQYLGFLLIFSGYSLSFGSLVITLVTAAGLFAIFRSRMLLEEKMLLDAFGNEYLEYMQRTWRLLPYIY